MTNLVPRKEAKRLRKERDTRPPRRGHVKSLGSHGHNRFLFSFLPCFPCPCDRIRFFAFLPLIALGGVSMFLPMRSSSPSLSPSTASFSWCTAAAAYVGVAIHSHNRQRRTPSSSEKQHSPPGVGCGGGISHGTSSSPLSPPSSRLFSSSTTWEDGYIEVSRPSPWSVGKFLKGSSKSRRYKLYYRIANPELLMPPSSSSADDDASADGIDDALERTGTSGADESSGPAPLLVVHGGPSLPSDYLLPLADALNIHGDDRHDHRARRSVVFYDQLGCGGSSEPRDVGAYSVEYAVDDMEVVIAELLGGGGGAEEAGSGVGCGRGVFHLYGHSFGGMLAHRYLRRIAERRRGDLGCDDDDEVGATTPTRCLSVVLSSTPTSIDESESSMNYVTERLLGQDPDLTTLNERFRRTCQCRTTDVPRPLADAFDRAGTVWAGTDAVVGFECSPPVVGSARMPPALIVGGEHDFVDPTGGRRRRGGSSSSAGRWWWTTTTSGSGYGCEDGGMLFNHDDVRVEVLGGCSHFCLLEDGARYGRVVESFLEEHDP